MSLVSTEVAKGARPAQTDSAVCLALYPAHPQEGPRASSPSNQHGNRFPLCLWCGSDSHWGVALVCRQASEKRSVIWWPPRPGTYFAYCTMTKAFLQAAVYGRGWRRVLPLFRETGSNWTDHQQRWIMKESTQLACTKRAALCSSNCLMFALTCSRNESQNFFIFPLPVWAGVLRGNIY